LVSVTCIITAAHKLEGTERYSSRLERLVVGSRMLFTWSPSFSLQRTKIDKESGGGIGVYLEPLILDSAPVALLLHFPRLLNGRPRDLELLLQAGPGSLQLPHLPTDHAHKSVQIFYAAHAKIGHLWAQSFSKRGAT